MYPCEKQNISSFVQGNHFGGFLVFLTLDLEVVFLEIKIPKEVRQHKETIFFGLSARQFFCAALGMGLAVGVYLGLGP